MRQISDISDEEILNAIAERGIGVLDNDDDTLFEELCEGLDADPGVDQANLHDRIDSILAAGQRLRSVGCSWFEVHPQEWAARLYGKSKEDIERVLTGNQ